MKDTKLLDSSIWLDFLFNGNHKAIIEGDDFLIVSALSLFEIKKKLLKKNTAILHIEKSLNFVKKRSLVVSVNEEIAEKAADISIKNKMPMADSIIYASALEQECEVITLDNHFKNLENCEVL